MNLQVGHWGLQVSLPVPVVGQVQILQLPQLTLLKIFLGCKRTLIHTKALNPKRLRWASKL